MPISREVFKLLIVTTIFLSINHRLSTINLVYAEEVTEFTKTKGAAFLQIPIGVRGIGMGGVGVAIPDGINSLWWNPACLYPIKDKEITGMYNSWFEDIGHEFVGYAQRVKDSVLAGSVNYLHIKDMEYHSGEHSVEPEGTFGAYDLALMLSYARKMSERLRLGANLKLIQEGIEDERATGFGVDLGVLYTSRLKDLNVGASLQNIGPEITFISKGYPLPLLIRAGISYKPLSSLTLAIDLNQEVDGELSLHSGIEYEYKGIVAGRVGYEWREDDSIVTAGIGFNVGGDFRLDYAFLPHKELGGTYKVSVLFVPLKLKEFFEVAPSPPVIYRCDSCGATFTSTSNFEKHRVIHPPSPSPSPGFSIFNIELSGVTSCEVTISWETDRPVDSRVYYGETTSFGFLKRDEDSHLFHRIQITGLIPETTYYYQVVSVDSEGNVVTSGVLNFTTLPL